MPDTRTLEELVEFNIYLLWADDAESSELPDDYTGGDWSHDAEAEGLLEAPRCSVHVRATYAGLSGENTALLCSYESQEEFERSSLCEPMKIAARRDLADKIRAQRLKLAEVAT